MLSEMVGMKRAARFTSRMSNERSAVELHPREMERVDGVAPWHRQRTGSLFGPLDFLSPFGAFRVLIG